MPTNDTDLLCPVCDSDHCDKSFEKYGYDLYRCRECDHLFVWPVPTIEQLEEAYSDPDHFASYFTEGRLPHRLAVAAQVDLIATLGLGPRFLEIGPGHGALLTYAKKAGFEVHASELSSHFARRLASQGILDASRIFVGDLLEMPVPDTGFDVIVMRATIEHFRHPGEYLDHIRRLLSPRGVFVIEAERFDCIDMRNLDAPWAHVGPPFHLHYFTSQGIQHLLTKHGFRVGHFDVSGFPRYTPPFSWRILLLNPVVRMLGEMFFDQSPIFYAYCFRDDSPLNMERFSPLRSRSLRMRCIMNRLLRMDV